MQHEREQWKSQIGFILAAMGSAIGLGNIWRFPYTAYSNGGFAFLVPYLIALLVVGIPLLIVEFGIGHHMKASAPMSLRQIDKRFGWIGWWAVTFVMFGIVIYYSVIIAWCLDYFFLSFTAGWGDDPSGFFFSSFLKITDAPAGGNTFTSGKPVWWILTGLTLVWAANWLITVKGVQKGIEKAVKIFMPVLLFIIIVLVLWSLTFKGAGEGLSYYLNPMKADWSKLTDPEIWVSAMGQIFFTLSLGFGIMIAYASYLPQNTNVVKAAGITALGNSAFSLFAALAVFATLGFIAQSSNMTVAELKENKVTLKDTISASEKNALTRMIGQENVTQLSQGLPESRVEKIFRNTGKSFEDQKNLFHSTSLSLAGPGLIFKTYPLTLNQIPGGRFFAILFFAALVIAGLSSSISIIEAFNAAIYDHFHISRFKSTTLLCVIGFLAGIPFTTGAGLYLLDVVDHFLNQYGLLTVGILESIVVGWYFTSKRLRSHIDEAADMKISHKGEMIMRTILTILLGFTWFALAKSPETGSIGAQVAMLLILFTIILMWLGEHWFDLNIKILIPALLTFILNGALVSEIKTNYGGYNTSFIFVGVIWMVITLITAGILEYITGRKKAEGK